MTTELNIFTRLVFDKPYIVQKSHDSSVKNEWSYTSTPQYSFMAWCWVKKHRDYFTFTVTLHCSDSC